MRIPPRSTTPIIGTFREREYGHYFDYQANGSGLYPEYPHIIHIVSGETRYARVLKTVAHVLCVEYYGDEGTDQTWSIRHV